MNKDTKISLLLDLYGSLLSKIQFESVDLYYNHDLSLSEISYHTGKSRQGVFEAIKRSKTILFEMESSLKLCEKIHTTNEKANKIICLASKIENSVGGSLEIFEAAKEIKQTAEDLINL